MGDTGVTLMRKDINKLFKSEGKWEGKLKQTL